MLKSNNQGRTLIEVIGVLSIIGLVAAGILSTIASAFDKYKISRIGQQLIEVQKAVSQRYGADENYANVDISTLVNEKLAPSDMMRPNDNKLYHRFGGEVEINNALPGARAMRITFNDVPQKACIELVTMSWINKDYTDLYSITLESAIYTWPNQRGANILHSLPIDMAEAMAVCKDSNEISWVFF